MRKIKKIYIHHSAYSGKHGIEDIRRWHLDRGFSDIGYHFVIEKDGTIKRGRPVEQIGAQVKGDNQDSLGICLCGDFEKEVVTQDMFGSLITLCISLVNVFGDIPILGHRDFKQAKTACPGKHLYSLLDDLRARVKYHYLKREFDCPSGGVRD